MTARGDALIMFGLTGDLAEKKLFPALVEMHEAGRLGIPVVGVSRTPFGVDALRWKMIDELGTDHADAVNAMDLHYVAGDAMAPETYDRIAEVLAQEGTEVTAPVVYAALPPNLFGGVAKGVAASSFGDRASLVVEKPFGRDLASAKELYAQITEHLDPDRLFAVDHFLAKGAVENLLTFRSANPLVERVMRAGFVDRVEVTMAENFGVDGRGSFYDGVGAVRDVVQNHLLQMIAILAMEIPDNDEPASFEHCRAELLRAVEPLDASSVAFGQFEGYRDLDDVPDDSTVETFVAARLAIDNDRWRGVPFLLRAGKEMAVNDTEAVVVFSGGSDGATPNRLRFTLKPEVAIAIEVGVLDPQTHGVRPSMLLACTPLGHGPLGDYATMLDGALDGEQRHFAQIGDIEAAWRIVDPILDPSEAPAAYPAGSMGPPGAATLMADAWAEPFEIEACGHGS